MSQAVEILAELHRRGVIVAVEGDTLCLKPRRALDDRLLARVRAAKPAILEALRNGPAMSAVNKKQRQRDAIAPCGSPHCAGCYVVDAETGAKIHPPKCGDEYRKWLERWQPKGKPQ